MSGVVSTTDAASTTLSFELTSNSLMASLSVSGPGMTSQLWDYLHRLLRRSFLSNFVIRDWRLVLYFFLSVVETDGNERHFD